MRICDDCGEEISVEHPKVKRRCQPCGRHVEKMRARAWRANNVDVRRDKAAALKRKYNMGIDDYEAMVFLQDSKCLVCDCVADVLVVDHCHETGVVRGLLCNLCNTGMGQLRDSAELLRSAARYLDTSPAAVR